MWQICRLQHLRSLPRLSWKANSGGRAQTGYSRQAHVREGLGHIYNGEWRDNWGNVQREPRGKHCEMDVPRRKNDLHFFLSISLSVRQNVSF